MLYKSQEMSIYQNLVNKNHIKYPARMGKKWEDDEVLKLLTSIKNNKSIPDIANEHERTITSINCQRRKLAADYWFNDKRPIEEIIKFTGLSEQEIEYEIKKRTDTKQKNTKTINEKPLEEVPSDMKEVISILKDIQGMLSIIVKKIQ